MAQERCNLDKDEAEILRPPSPSPSSASPPQPAVAPPSTRYLMPPHKRPRQREESPVAKRKEEESLPADAAASATGPEPTGTQQAASPPPVIRTVNRCLTCQKRVGLTGFRCRCGDLFCPRHRYSDSHGCSFDYKAAGREEIAKANPVIRAAKIIKI